jgi:polyhydroxybutyrate depolymerase
VVAGISNGAFMAHRLATEASDRVAVLAAVAGGLPAALRDTPPDHAVSAMLINGTADRRQPIEGGYSRRLGPNGERRGRTLSLRETAEHWRTVDRCPAGPGEIHETELSSRMTFGGGTGGSRVVAWTVFGGGHSWPGAPTPPEWGEPTTREFDAAEEICRFAMPLLADAGARRLTAQPGRRRGRVTP